MFVRHCLRFAVAIKKTFEKDDDAIIICRHNGANIHQDYHTVVCMRKYTQYTYTAQEVQERVAFAALLTLSSNGRHLRILSCT